MVNEIIDILLEYVEPDDEITADTNIKSELGMSSFDLVCFADEIHERYEIVLTADNFRELSTVGELSEFICRNK